MVSEKVAIAGGGALPVGNPRVEFGGISGPSAGGRWEG